MTEDDYPEHRVVSWLAFRDGLRVIAKLLIIASASYVAFTSNRILNPSSTNPPSETEVLLSFGAVFLTAVMGVFLLFLEPRVLWVLVSKSQRQRSAIVALEKEKRVGLSNIECIGRLGDLAKSVRKFNPLATNQTIEQFEDLLNQLIGPMDSELPAFYELPDRPAKYSIAIYIVTEDDQVLECVYRCRNFSQKTPSRPWSVTADREVSHIVQCFVQNLRLFSSDVSAHIERDTLPNNDQGRYHSVLCFPIAVRNSESPTGVLCIASSEPNHFSKHNVSGFTARSEILITLLTQVIESSKIKL